VRGDPASPGWTEFGLVRTAVAFTLLAGAVAVALPFLNALVVALAAIAIAGAARSRWSRRDARPRRDRWLRWIAAASVVVGGVLFVALPVPWSVGRGLVLGVALLPAAAIDHCDRGGNPGGPRGP
jgi:hypothetical protein